MSARGAYSEALHPIRLACPYQVQVFESGPVLARYSYKDVNFEDGTGVFDAAGNAITVFSEMGANGNLTYRETHTETANGLSSTTSIDADGNICYQLDASVDRRFFTATWKDK